MQPRPDAAATASSVNAADGVRSLGGSGAWTGFLATCGLLATIACSEDNVDKPDAKPSDATADASPDASTDDVGDVGTDAEDGGQGDTDSKDDDADGGGSGSDTDAAGADADAAGADITGEDGAGEDADVGPQCVTAADCKDKVTLLGCQSAACEEGACKAVTTNGKCCGDSDCEDGNECTQDACDTSKQACLQTPVPNCCSGKLTLLKTGFETGVGDVQIATGTTNGNVGWQATTARAHSGDQSLYFGNACASYDTTQTTETGCLPGAAAAAVSGSATSKPIALPKEKSIQLHFWLWLDSEPPYSETLPKGICNTPCATGSACVAVNGGGQCLPEKDVLSVIVLPEGGAPLKLFDSTQIGKTTKGGWQRIVLDLDSFQGKNVRVQWQFQTISGFKNDFEGFYIDDVMMETICAVEGTLCGAATKCKDDGNVCSVDDCTLYSNAASKGFCFHDTKVGCCLIDANCNDGKACTVDTCKAGVCQYTPDSSKAECCKPSVTANHDFDSGTLTGFNFLKGNSSEVGWKLDPKGGSKGSQALFFGNAALTDYADPTLPVGKGPKGTICAPPTKLKVGTLFNLLTFQLQMETEWSYLPKGAYKNPPLAGQPKFDHLEVGVREEGIGSTEIKQLWSSDIIAGSTEGKWLEVTVALDAWQGKEISVCLTFDAGDDQVNDRAGVRIDELLVKVACSKPECLVDNDCGGLSCAACQVPSCTNGVCGCQKVSGCCIGNSDCDDGNPCTNDSCKDSVCAHETVADCCKADSQCKSGDICQQPICDLTTKQCKTTPVANCCKIDKDCDKELLCVIPKCTANQCVDQPIAGCCKADIECDDGKKCTEDLCIDLKCTSTPKPGCN